MELEDARETVFKGFVEELEDLEIRRWVEAIQTTALLRSARTLRRVQETWRDLQSLKHMRESISKRKCEKISKE